MKLIVAFSIFLFVSISCDKVNGQKVFEFSKMMDDAGSSLTSGELEETIKLNKEAIKLRSPCYVCAYNLACAYSLKNDLTNAFHWLSVAIDWDLASIEHLKTDPDLDNLRSDPRYNSLLQKIEKRNVLLSTGLEQSRQLIVMIDCKIDGSTVGSGAGIIFGQDNNYVYVVTANHVVGRRREQKPLSKVCFRMKPDAWYDADLTSHVDDTLDIAVLRVAKNNISVGEILFKQLGNASLLSRGDSVFHIGYPEGRKWRTNVTPDRFSEQDGGRSLFFESRSVKPGNSGGGLFNKYWELIGMIRSVGDPEGEAIEMSHIINRLRQWNYPIDLQYTLLANTKISYMGIHEGSIELYTMNIDGTKPTRLTNLKDRNGMNLSAYQTIWSPNGKAIAFTYFNVDNSEIYTLNSDGSKLRNVTNHKADDYFPGWSPDGKKIVFQSSRNKLDSSIYRKDEILITNNEGSPAINLTKYSGDDGAPSFSPDGKRIVFESRRDSLTDIYVMNIDGTNILNLTKNSKRNNGLPIWSPDGSMIAYESDDDLIIANSDGSHPIKLVEANQPMGMRWSPDGKKIALAAEGTQYMEYYVLEINGPSLIKLTEGAVANHFPPSWSPDGTKLVFMMATEDENEGIYVINGDGSGLKRLTKGQAEGFAPVWSPYLK